MPATMSRGRLREEGGVKAGLLINATRVAIVGQAVAPPLFDTMVVLGQERVVRRLRAALGNSRSKLSCVVGVSSTALIGSNQRYCFCVS